MTSPVLVVGQTFAVTADAVGVTVFVAVSVVRGQRYGLLQNRRRHARIINFFGAVFAGHAAVIGQQTQVIGMNARRGDGQADSTGGDASNSQATEFA